MQSLQPYHNSYEGAPAHLQDKAKQLCREYNQTAPREEERRRAILQQLFGSYNPQTFIEPSFHCDYGFNIHTHGLAFLNYNCVILDTSPVHIGADVFIAPGVCLAARGMQSIRHSGQRASVLPRRLQSRTASGSGPM
ncbi:maltose acetyltransferase domain-containing protein [Stomatobaculum longum]|uniref:maltose acetyltransferase domain-containing protein n=1 Tax=Stomatobaculum longum TaxID=796942 RepID=UPI002804B403|nr:maltose acetyltransferase domain-containing protein [Stomatobaculum longum]